MLILLIPEDRGPTICGGRPDIMKSRSNSICHNSGRESDGEDSGHQTFPLVINLRVTIPVRYR